MILIMIILMILVMTILATIFDTPPETGDRLGARQPQDSLSRQRSSSCGDRKLEGLASLGL